MWNFNFVAIMGLMKKTYPFLIFRLLVYTAISLIAIAITGTGAGIGWIGGSIMDKAPDGVAWGGLAGASGAAYFLYVVREYVLYQVKAGHIVLLLKFMDGEPVPDGKGMVEYASGQVKEHFKESSALFGVDQLIKGVLKVISGVFNTLANVIPIPGLAPIVNFTNKIVSMSLTYVDEIILAYYIKNGSTNIWTESSKGLVLYAQNYRNMLKNAFWISLMVWGLTLLVFILVLGPFAALAVAFPSLAGVWTFAIAAVLAWGVKSAVIDPIAMTAMMQVYFKAIEGQTPDAEWENKLNQMSGKFRTLTEKGQALAPKNINPFPSATHDALK